MKPTKEKVAAELKKLRSVVENSNDPAETRIAYAMEHAIRWATEETVGWTKPHKEAAEFAKLIRSEI